MEVDEDSKEFLTINIHKGLFRYNRLPFCMKSVPVLFQQTMDAMMTGLTGGTGFIDISVAEVTQDELPKDAIFLFPNNIAGC